MYSELSTDYPLAVCDRYTDHGIDNACEGVMTVTRENSLICSKCGRGDGHASYESFNSELRILMCRIEQGDHGGMPEAVVRFVVDELRHHMRRDTPDRLYEETMSYGRTAHKPIYYEPIVTAYNPGYEISPDTFVRSTTKLKKGIIL